MKNYAETTDVELSQSTIKMEKGYYHNCDNQKWHFMPSQSTIKMEKGYYFNV